MATPKQLGARKRWINALESGKFKQANGALVNKDEEGKVLGYCCLGVLCELAKKEGILKNNFDSAYYLEKFPEVKNWVGLETDAGGFQGEKGYTSLAVLNDGDNLNKSRSFKQIAKVIKSNPEGLFTS